MRIAIYGAGAVGGHLAARLALGGQDISVIARGAHLDAMRARGLILQTTTESDRAAKVYATDRPADCGHQNAVFVTVKAYSLRDIAEHIRPLVGPDTLVVFAQNGMPWWYPLGLPPDKPRPPSVANFALAESFLSVTSADRVAGAVVDASSEIAQPGVIRNSSNANRLTLALIDDRIGPELNTLRRAITNAGYTSPAVPAIREVVWLKLMRNMSTSPIAMATQNKSSVVLHDPALGEIFLRMVGEGMSIARAAGYPLDAITSPEKMLAATTDVVPSLLQDFRLGRRVEIDALLDGPLAFARAAGVATPTIDAIAAIVRRLAEDKGLI